MGSRARRSGLVHSDPQRAHECLVCFSSLDFKTHLIDPHGKEAHRWEYAGQPGNLIDPAVNGGRRGHVLVQYEDDEHDRESIFGNRTVAELDWNGKVVWKWGEQAPGGKARQNHDWTRLANGNTLLVVARPAVVPELAAHEIGDQALLEVAPNGAVVWSWAAGDHIGEFGLSDAGLDHLRQMLARGFRDPWGYFEINNAQILGPNPWHEQGHSAFHPDNIIIDSRKANFIVIIEKATGKIVWRAGPYGDPYANYEERIHNNRVPRPLDQTAGQHSAHLIAPGLPGAGNLLLLDNQGSSGYPPVGLGEYAGSRVLEVNPVTREIVWQYTADDSGDPVWTFFTSFVGNVQRLPNGATLINEGMNGRIFQVAPDGEIVWEYVNPFPGRVDNPYPGHVTVPGRTLRDPTVYRAQAVPFDWLPEGALSVNVTSALYFSIWQRDESRQDARLERLSAATFRLLAATSPPLADCGGFAPAAARSLQRIPTIATAWLSAETRR